MDPFGTSIGVGAVLFAATNIDDLFILSAFFADPCIARRSVVIGQFAGIGALVLASAAAALLSAAVPEGWVAFLGLVPLFLGISRLPALRHSFAGEAGDADERQILEKERSSERRLHSQALAVTAVTIANGGDNLGAYIPLFASDPKAIPVYVVVFAVMTGVWCVFGRVLVTNRFAGGVIRRYGPILLPVVLIALGLSILSGASALFR